MSEETKVAEIYPFVEALDKIVEASSNYLRAIFPPLFKMANIKEEEKAEEPKKE